jgi:hypothetical protein
MQKWHSAIFVFYIAGRAKMLTSYRGMRVDTEARITSANPGDPCTSVSAPGMQGQSSALAPNYENSAIARKISKEIICTFGQAEVLLRDCSNFLWMAAKSSEVSVPSPIIDEAWHVFILFTKEYMQFCHDHCGGYVHHAPHTGPELRMTTDYVKPTVDMLHTNFGGKPNGNWDYISVKERTIENRVGIC